VLPDADAVSGAIDRLLNRARVLTAVEAASIGTVVAAWSAPLGLAVAIGVAIVRSRGTSRREVVRRLELANPALNNLIVTFEEVRGGAIAAKPAVAERVFRDARAGIEAIDPRRFLPARRLTALLMLAAAVWFVRAGVSQRRETATSAARPGGLAPAATPSATGELRVTVTIRPPAYTNLPQSQQVNPSELRPIENSVLEFAIEGRPERRDRGERRQAHDRQGREPIAGGPDDSDPQRLCDRHR
jgi:hypothetical protein